MKTGMKLGIVVVIALALVAIGVIDWNALFGKSGGAAPVDQEPPTRPEKPVLAPDACYAGDWVGCWEYAVNNNGRPPIVVHEDGCTVTGGRIDEFLNLVFAFALSGRKVLGPEDGETFDAPPGSVIYYAIPRGRGYDGDPEGAIDERRGEDGLLPEDDPILYAWVILSERYDGHRTLAIVKKDSPVEGEEPTKVQEYPLVRTDCPE